MGDIYASAVGTTVLQLKEIPTRPKDFEGALYIGELLEGVDEKKIRDALKRFGSIESCYLPKSQDRPGQQLSSSSQYAIVRFSKHSAATKAAEADASVLVSSFLWLRAIGASFI